jgi:hypothetical protein
MSTADAAVDTNISDRTFPQERKLDWPGETPDAQRTAYVARSQRGVAVPPAMGAASYNARTLGVSRSVLTILHRKKIQGHIR